MSSALCDRLGISFPLFGFSHCRDVVAEVSRSGGLGVLGISGSTPDAVAADIAWLNEHVGAAGFGVDLLIPEHVSSAGFGGDRHDVEIDIPLTHHEFVRDILSRFNIRVRSQGSTISSRLTRLSEQTAHELLDIALGPNTKLIASALGPAPKSLVDRAHERGVMAAGLVGAKEHAVRQAQRGVDLIVAQGYEAAGHTGEVGSMVLIPEVVSALKEEFPSVAVVGAGGIVTGRQMAAAMALGAQGVWCGSMWLTTLESELTPIMRSKMLAATSRDTVRSKSRTGKYSRQLRSAWTDAWEAPGAPSPLPMPLQSVLCEGVLRDIARAADRGSETAKDLATYWVGQGIGLIDEARRTRDVISEMMEEFLDVCRGLGGVPDQL